ncbi:hypothetical protein [Candidatus Spongiihabitans sp.]
MSFRGFAAVVSGYAGRHISLDSRFAPLFIILAFGGNDKQERRE